MEDRSSTLNRYEAAVAYYQEAVQREPENAEARYYLGRAYWQLNRRSEAVETWKETLRLQPDHVRARDCLVQAGVECEPLAAPSRTRGLRTSARRPSLKQSVHRQTDGFDFQALLEGGSLVSEPDSKLGPYQGAATQKEFPRILVAGMMGAQASEKRTDPATPRRTHVLIPAGVGLCLILAAGAVAFSLHSRTDSTPSPKTVPPSASAVNAATSTTAKRDKTIPSEHSHKKGSPFTAANTKPEKAKVAVYIGGAVQKPGVYSLPPKARVADIILMAGSTTKDADLAKIDLMARLQDGQKILIPAHKQPVTVAPALFRGAAQSIQNAANLTKGKSPKTPAPPSTQHHGEELQTGNLALTSPGSGANVHGRMCDVSGTSNLPNGTSLTLVVVTRDGTKWPQTSHPVVTEGAFSGFVYLGEDNIGIGQTYEVYAETPSGSRSSALMVHRVD
jgi:DNA uptake protein ComE-like DNA-binding protein